MPPDRSKSGKGSSLKRGVRKLKCGICRIYYDYELSKLNGHFGYCSKDCLAKLVVKLRHKKALAKLESRNIADYKRKLKKIRKRLKRSERLAKSKRINDHRTSSEQFFESREWKNLRFKVFGLYGRVCMCCGARPPGIILHVDHIKPRFYYPELALDLNNLQVLCADCNLGKGARYETDFRPKVILTTP